MATVLKTIYQFRTIGFANSIYIYNSKKFSDIPTEYYIPVEQFAATTYTQEQLDNALAQNYITQQQYDETMSYRTV